MLRYLTSYIFLRSPSPQAYMLTSSIAKTAGWTVDSDMMATLIWDVSYAARTDGNGWWFMNSYPLRCSGKVSDMPADLIVELLG